MLPLRKSIRSLFTGLLPNGAQNGAGHSSGLPAVIALISSEEDRRVLKKLATHEPLELQFADTCGEAWNAANRATAAVVLCQRGIPDMEWRDVVKILASAVPRPCVIVTSEAVNDRLWHETVALGGYDVLVRPLREDDAARSIRRALLYWKTLRENHGVQNT